MQRAQCTHVHMHIVGVRSVIPTPTHKQKSVRRGSNLVHSGPTLVDGKAKLVEVRPRPHPMQNSGRPSRREISDNPRGVPLAAPRRGRPTRCGRLSARSPLPPHAATPRRERIASASQGVLGRRGASRSVARRRAASHGVARRLAASRGVAWRHGARRVGLPERCAASQGHPGVVARVAGRHGAGDARRRAASRRVSRRRGAVARAVVRRCEASLGASRGRRGNIAQASRGIARRRGASRGPTTVRQELTPGRCPGSSPWRRPWSGGSASAALSPGRPCRLRGRGPAATRCDCAAPAPTRRRCRCRRLATAAAPPPRLSPHVARSVARGVA